MKYFRKDRRVQCAPTIGWIPTALLIIACQFNNAPIQAKEANQLLAQAEKEATQGNWRKAATLLTGICRENSEDPVAFYDLGVAYFHLGDFSNAQIAVERALEIDPKLVSGYIQLATIKARTGDNQGAKTSLERALLLEPNNQSVQLNLKAIVTAAAQPVFVTITASAEKSDKLAVSEQLSGKDDKIEFVAGVPAMIFRADRYPDKLPGSGGPSAPSTQDTPLLNVQNAAAKPSDVTKEQPASLTADDLDKQLKLGFAALSNKNWAGAAYIYGEITKINETNAQAWLGLGLARFKLNDKDSALVAFQKAVTLAPHDAAAQAAIQLAAATEVQSSVFPDMRGQSAVFPAGTTEPREISRTPAVSGGKIGIGTNSDPL
jgi:tetratricopeptide (TPR) repeat protein